MIVAQIHGVLTSALPRLLVCALPLTGTTTASSILSPLQVRLISSQSDDCGTTYTPSPSSVILADQSTSDTDATGARVDATFRSAATNTTRSNAGASLSVQTSATYHAVQRQKTEQDAAHFSFTADYAMTTTLDSTIRIQNAANFFYISHAEVMVASRFQRSLRLVPDQPLKIHLELSVASKDFDFRTIRPTLLFGPSPDSLYAKPSLPFFRLTNQNFFELAGTNPLSKIGTTRGVAYSIQGSASAEGVSLDLLLEPDGSLPAWELELRWVLQTQTKITHGPYTFGTHVDDSAESLTFQEQVLVSQIPEPNMAAMLALAWAAMLGFRRCRVPLALQTV